MNGSTDTTALVAALQAQTQTMQQVIETNQQSTQATFALADAVMKMAESNQEVLDYLLADEAGEADEAEGHGPVFLDPDED
ncbi:hypothetical protein [Vreelandella sp. GE22]